MTDQENGLPPWDKIWMSRDCVESAAVPQKRYADEGDLEYLLATPKRKTAEELYAVLFHMYESEQTPAMLERAQKVLAKARGETE